MEPFTKKNLESAFKKEKEGQATLKCNGNALWVGPNQSGAPGVSWSAHQMSLIKNDYLVNNEAPPAEVSPYVFTCCLEDSHEWTPAHKTLQQQSAEEPYVTAILCIEDLIIETKKTDPSIKENKHKEKFTAWARTLANATFVFPREPAGLARYWFAQKLRKQSASNHAALSRLPSQQAYSRNGKKQQHCPVPKCQVSSKRKLTTFHGQMLSNQPCIPETVWRV